jgi:hypothetical protein
MASTARDDLVVAFVSADFQPVLLCKRFGSGHKGFLDANRTKFALGQAVNGQMVGTRTARVY